MALQVIRISDNGFAVILTNLQADLLAILGTLAAQGYQTGDLLFEPPAGEGDVSAVEMELGISLPSSFRKLLTTVSGHVDFYWFRPDELEYPHPFRENFCGQLNWSLKNLVHFETIRQNWIETCFPDVENDYDRVWHEKLAFQDVGNGDMIAIDLRFDHIGEVVYLSHDDGEGHGMVLAPSVCELIERWVPLACTGGEDGQWLPFFEKGRGLSADGANAHAWRSLLKLDQQGQ